MESKKKLSIPQLAEMKRQGRKIAMITAYDYPTAVLVDQSPMDILLVGDSLGNVVLGYESTLPVTMDDMVHHTRAVVRGARNTLVVADMPFMSYQVSVEDAIRNAGRLMKQGGADAIKLEGGEVSAEAIRAIVAAGIPVMAHIGLTPQSATMLGGYKVQGKDAARGKALLRDARAVEGAGAFSMVVETIPAQLAELITRESSIPTIGIGAGPHCDGQVLVLHDAIGLFPRFVPKFVKRYASLSEPIAAALADYCREVEAGEFPAAEHCFNMKQEEIDRILER